MPTIVCFDEVGLQEKYLFFLMQKEFVSVIIYTKIIS